MNFVSQARCLQENRPSETLGLAGGGNNTIGSKAIYNSIVGGQNNNVINSSFTGILGGSNNAINTVANFGVIAGGNQNCIQGQVSQVFSAIGGGQLNTMSGNHAVISGGHSNIVSGNCSAILGGSGNNDGGFAYAGVYGYNVTANTSCAFHANNFVAQNIPPGLGGGVPPLGALPGSFYWEPGLGGFRAVYVV